MLQQLFPREADTNQYNIPKMHGMTNFQDYIKRYGSAMNFFGGPGEAAHKYFAKAPGQKKQRRISEFATQIAKQYSDVMIMKHAMRIVHDVDSNFFQYGSVINEDHDCKRSTTNKEVDSALDCDVLVHMSGRYVLTITPEVMKAIQENNEISMSWIIDRKKIKQRTVSFVWIKTL